MKFVSHTLRLSKYRSNFKLWRTYRYRGFGSANNQVQRRRIAFVLLLLLSERFRYASGRALVVRSNLRRLQTLAGSNQNVAWEHLVPARLMPSRNSGNGNEQEPTYLLIQVVDNVEL